jgi:hypothetical protein
VAGVGHSRTKAAKVIASQAQEAMKNLEGECHDTATEDDDRPGGG